MTSYPPGRLTISELRDALVIVEKIERLTKLINCVKNDPSIMMKVHCSFEGEPALAKGEPALAADLMHDDLLQLAITLKDGARNQLRAYGITPEPEMEMGNVGNTEAERPRARPTGGRIG